MLDEAYETLRVDGDRLWGRLMAMAQIGATPKGGVNRLTLTDEDKAGRDLFIRWCQDAGCTITVDQMGNIFSRRVERRPRTLGQESPVLVGSHLDSQPTGGKFDGALGVLAGLEVIETLNDNNITTKVPLEIVSWTNEEGARFAPAMIASGVFAGVFDLDYALSLRDKNGLRFGTELERIGYAGVAKVGGRSFKAMFELHIEQGPILEIQGKTIGIVTGVQGIRWYDLVIVGKEAHAGPTLMSHRHDPIKVMLPILQGIYELADQYSPLGRATIGDVAAEPGVINTVPGRLTLKVDLRHPEAVALEAMDQALRKIVHDTCQTAGMSGQVHDIWFSPPVKFDAGCIDSVRKAAEIVDAPATEMVSGAGHDAAYIARAAPTSMIFIPCEDGLSHNELESVKKVDAITGTNVLLQAVLAQAA